MEIPGIRLVHIDRELSALSRIQPERRTDAWWWAIDHWLEERITLTRPFRNYSVPVVPGYPRS